MGGPSTPARHGAGGGGDGDGGGGGSTSSSIPPPPPPKQQQAGHDAPPPSFFPLWNRLVLSLLAMSLLWASSLRTAVFFTGYFVHIPPASFPLQVCRTAFDAISAQATAYSACAARQLAKCHADLDFAAEQERNRSGVAEAANNLKLDAAERLFSDCGTALTTSQAAILRWTQLSNLHEVPYVETTDADGRCSAADKTQAQAVLGDSSGSRSQVMASSAQYSKEAKGTVRRMAEYTQALNAYNAEYLTNKTQAIRTDAVAMVAGVNTLRIGTINASFADVRLHLADLVACLASGTATTGSCPLPGVNARQRLDRMLEELQHRFGNASVEFGKWIENYHNVSVAGMASFDAFVDFYNSLLDAIDDLGLRAADFGDLLTIDPGIFLVSPGIFYDGEGIVFDLDPMPFALTLDGIWADVRPAVDVAMGRISLASVDTTLRARQWAQALEVSLGGLDVAPDDYNPPRYVGGDGEPTSVEAEVAAHEAMADTFVARTATSLDAFDSYNQYVDSSTSKNLSEGNTSLVLENLPSFDFSFNLKYETLESPAIDVDALLRLFDDLPSLAFVTDYAYRIYGSLRILWKFRTQTALKLPTVDLRTGALPSLSRGAEACIDAWQAANPRRLLARLLASRYLPYILLTGVLLPLLVYGMLLYVAAYRDYQRGCVFNTNPRGSYAARTTNSLTFNFAAYGGNQAMYDGLKSYNQRRAQYCADYGKASQGAQLNAERYLATMRAAREEARGRVQLLNSCLNLTTLDDGFARGCCGLAGVPMAPFDSNSTANPSYYQSCAAAGYPNSPTNGSCPVNPNYDPARPFPPLSTTLGAPACFDPPLASTATADAWTLADGVFHCEVLPSCTPTCSGPHPELTQAWSRHCACATEWALHAYVIAGSLAVLAYLLLNLARRLLLQAVAQAQWRSLFAGTLTVLAPCDLHGNLVIRPAPSSSPTHPRWGRHRWRAPGPLSLSRATARVAPSSPEPSAPPAVEEDQGRVRLLHQAKSDGGGMGGEGPVPDAAGGAGGSSNSNSSSSPVAPARGQERAMEGQQAFVRRRVEAMMRTYERAAWAKGLVAVGLLLGAGLLISMAPQFLDYRP